MKGIIIILFLFGGLVNAQPAFKTIIPQHPVVTGESFQVQYIIEDDAELSQIRIPAFPGFRIVSGPNVYYGSVSTIHGVKLVRNTVYTLAAMKPGKFRIPPAIIHGPEGELRSNEVMIEVISKDEALKNFNKDGRNSGYLLKPGEDAYKKIQQNLFVKVMVDKQTCYVGEPVLATFKLYSRLESRSDIVKNPGFYGFTVYDMINLSDKLVVTEDVNGKIFDVHTIRKVQLYALQAGEYTIDPMMVKNKVE